MKRGELKIGDSQIIIYQTPDGTTNLDVKLEDETVWLTQNQMVELFETTKQNVSLHIQNVFKDGELSKDSTAKDYLTVQTEGKRTVKRTVSYYNLDVIISVGYRVKSKQGIQFRVWANQVLKEYLIKGYAINQKIKTKQYDELKQTVRLLANVIKNKDLSADEATGLLQVITDYTYALDTLDRYDYQQLTVERTTEGDKFHATYENAMEVIMSLKNKFGGSSLFGNEKDESFKSSISTIYQTFGGNELYPSIEEKAAMLL
jgi:Virulence protein